MTQDKSLGFRETKQFVQNRLENANQLKQAASSVCICCASKTSFAVDIFTFAMIMNRQCSLPTLYTSSLPLSAFICLVFHLLKPTHNLWPYHPKTMLHCR